MCATCGIQLEMSEMGIWARANGIEPPKLPTFNVVRSRPGLDYPTAAEREPLALQVDVQYDALADGMTWVARFPDVGMKRTETSQVRAFVWAVRIGQKFADRAGQPVTVRHLFWNSPDLDPFPAIVAAAWRGEMGEAGYATYGTSEDDEPIQPGLTTLLPSWMTPAMRAAF